MERTEFHRLSSVFCSKAVACTTSVNKQVKKKRRRRRRRIEEEGKRGRRREEEKQQLSLHRGTCGDTGGPDYQGFSTSVEERSINNNDYVSSSLVGPIRKIL